MTVRTNFFRFGILWEGWVDSGAPGDDPVGITVEVSGGVNKQSISSFKYAP